MFLAKMNYLEVEEYLKKSDTIVIPVGSLENHGKHMPLGTDTMIPDKIAELLDAKSDLLIAPTINYGATDDLVGFAGTVSIGTEGLIALLRTICDQLYRYGFRHFMILNGHGGNTAMLRHFLRMQTYEEKKYATLMTSAFAFRDIDPKRLYNTVKTRKKEFSYLTEEDLRTLERYSKSGTGGGHADIRETSLVMTHDDGLVAENRYEAECGLSNHRTDHLDTLGIESANSWLASHPASYEAYPPHGATKTIGKAMLAVCAERLAKIFKAVKEDEDCVRSAALLPKTD